MSGDWRRDANCRDRDPGLFFAPDGEGRAGEGRRLAKAREICAACPVSGPCLEFRLGFPEQRDGGVWAGLDEEQRYRLHRNMIRNERERQDRRRRQEERAA